MSAEYREWKDTEIEGYPVRVCHYSRGNGYVTEIECKKSGEIVARGSGATPDESALLALEVVTRRVRRVRSFDLTVGG